MQHKFLAEFILCEFSSDSQISILHCVAFCGDLQKNSLIFLKIFKFFKIEDDKVEAQ